MTHPQDTNEGPNPSGLCQCGCGQRTRISPVNDKNRGWVRGKPVRFVTGHAARVPSSKFHYEGVGPNPSGLCMCGCGEKTPIAEYTHRSRGNVKGYPQKYAFGHKPRKGVLELEGTHYVVDGASGCWLWIGATTKDGYGSCPLHRNGTSRAHKVFFEELRGRVPVGLVLDHRCPNGPNTLCVNPDHLFPCTNTENIRRAKSTKLTLEQVEEIRELAECFTQREISRRFGISNQHVSRIVSGQRWPPD